MVFSSLEFLLRFLPLVLLLYFIVPTKFKNAVLLIASLYFYAWGEPVYIVLIVTFCIVNYALALGMDKNKNTVVAKTFYIAAFVINILLLGFFKYADFLIENLNTILDANIGLLHLQLPLAISFTTFQVLSYTIDVYRSHTPVHKNPFTFIMYIMQFPQLVAGPIVRYSTIAQEFDSRTHSIDQFATGVRRFVLGLGKKVIIGNNIGHLWELANSTENPSLLLSWLGIVAYALQIYYDFSGYTDMAIGLGCMFGFHFPENFDFPYFSQSITEFWRRWHITLGRWFRDYVYFPLGGNRVSPVKWIRNILLVWLLTGLWHGASWNFCLWGLYFGIVLIIEKLFLLKVLTRLPGILRHGYASLLIIVGWVIFGLGTIPEILSYLGNMFRLNGIALYNFESLYMLRSNFILLVIAFCGALPIFSNMYKRFSDKALVGALVMPVFYTFVLVVSLAYIVDSSFNPFLYFRF